MALVSLLLQKLNAEGAEKEDRLGLVVSSRFSGASASSSAALATTEAGGARGGALTVYGSAATQCELLKQTRVPVVTFKRKDGFSCKGRFQRKELQE